MMIRGGDNNGTRAVGAQGCSCNGSDKGMQ